MTMCRKIKYRNDYTTVFKVVIPVVFTMTIIRFCEKRPLDIVEVYSTKLSIDSTCNEISDRELTNYLLPYKQIIDDTLNSIVGYTTAAMEVSRPESLLSNLCSDIMLWAFQNNFDSVADLSIVNIGGIRSSLPSGAVTLRNIFELMPFENELVVLWISGDNLVALFDTIARLGGEGISGVSMGIDKERAVNVIIKGEPIKNDKIYTVVTSDYLAAGNDKLTPLTRHLKRLNTGLKIRNIYIDYMIAQTKNGKKINSQLDQRIYYVQN